MSLPDPGEPVIGRIAALCEADPEREACGLVVERGGAFEVLRVENVADRWHAEDPVAHPGTSRDSFVMDPGALLRIHRDLRARGGRIVTVWHSHVGAGAHLSARDRADAVVDGEPVLPGAEYLIVGLRAGRAAEIRRYRFEAGAFREAPTEPVRR